MSKLAPGSPPIMKAGRRIRPGEISGVSQFVPQEIRGANGVQVQQYGNRVVIRGNTTKARGGGGGSVLFLGDVLALPPVPSASGAYCCKWLSTGGGTGDGQLWWCNGGDTVWTAGQRLTSLSGVPV